MTHDVVIIGGSYAGMAAALQLVRAHRRVLIIDAGQRRNRAASHAYGFVGQDGIDPAVIAAQARAQLMLYPTLTWVAGAVVALAGKRDDFTVTTDAGAVYAARRVIFAVGVADTLPAIPGLADRWGQHVFHCPYCHGFELAKGRIGVITAGPNSLHQAKLLPEWGQVTFFVNGALALDDAARADLAARGVVVEEAPISHLDGAADVVLADGRVLSFAGVFTAPVNAPASQVAADFGCDIAESPFGTMIGTDQGKQTSVAGVYACGDVARVPHSLSLAVADGAWAGGQVHAGLVFG
ncbi:NAD(P)/FAD-dependent oxidoreductase [Yoonia sp.]|uniref:NAD(P)/FAD-dependent oxidoreductase n=1 Tax=Yoonia sp. TaxID=2212373 RepID=UPI00391BE660